MDKLIVEGVNSKGFGTIPKAVMVWPSEDITDTHGNIIAHGLSYTAKTLLGLLYSYAGSGITAFPSRDTICSCLQIHKETFHKYMKLIENTGLLTKTQKVKKDGKFGNNIYTLKVKPQLHPDLIEHLIDRVYPDKNNPVRLEKKSDFRIHGINFLGYGIAPKYVIQFSNYDTADKDGKRIPGLTLIAKAIYLYLSAWAGSEDKTDIDTKRILNHLGITEDTYYKHLKLLKTNGFVLTKKQKTAKSKYPVNVFHLPQIPTPAADPERSPMKPDTAYEKHSPTISDTVKEYSPMKPDTARKHSPTKPSTVKPDTNNNNTFIINNKQQQHSSYLVLRGSNNKIEDNVVVDSSVILKIIKEYNTITGQNDLTPMLLTRRLSKLHDIELTEEYLQEKLLVLKQNLEKTKNPAGFFITAITQDWKPALELQEQTKAGPIEPVCPECSIPISECICYKKQESPVTTAFRDEANNALAELGLADQARGLFAYIEATIDDTGRILLYPIASIFVDKILSNSKIIDQVMQQLDKPYELVI